MAFKTKKLFFNQWLYFSFILQVSADFLRLNGSRQQFRNLLSARKKLGQMPPAYTRIDYSHDSIESQSKILFLWVSHLYPNLKIRDSLEQFFVFDRKQLI